MPAPASGFGLAAILPEMVGIVVMEPAGAAATPKSFAGLNIYVAVIAYGVAVMVTPLVFFALRAVYWIPMARAFWFMGPVGMYVFTAICALFCAAPGFVLARLGLRWFNVTSALGFAGAGALVGASAVGFFLMPQQVFLLLGFQIAFYALGVGACIGLVYWGVERLAAAWLHQRVMRGETVR